MTRNDAYRAAAGLLACTGVAQGTQVEGDSEQESAYHLTAAYTGEVWRNTRGGLRTGSTYLDNIDLQLEVDGARAWGMNGLTLFAYLLHNNGNTLSENLVGDAQAVSNIEAGTHPLIYELWLDWQLGAADSDRSLRVGLYDLNTEFDASEVGSLFVNSSHGVGAQLSQTGEAGPSIFPVTSFGVRLGWSFTDNWTLRFAALDGVPGDPDNPRRPAIRLSGRDGALLIAESDTHVGFGHFKIGAWSYTARFPHLTHVDEAGEPVMRRNNRGAYVLGEARLWTSGDRPDASLDGYARFGTASGAVNRFDEFFGFGVVLNSPVPERPDDKLGLGVTVPRNGDEYRTLLASEDTPTDRREYAIELTYRAVLGAFELQPMAQYIVNPDTTPDRADALALGMRFSYAWER